MGRFQDPRGWRGGGSRGTLSSTCLLLLLVAGAAFGAQDTGRRNAWHAETRDQRFFSHHSADHGKTRSLRDETRYQDFPQGFSSHHSAAPGKARFLSLDHGIHEPHHSHRLEARFPQELRTSSSQKQSQPPHSVAGVRPMPQQSQSLPASHSSRLEFGPGWQLHSLAHSGRVGRSHLHRNSKRRPHSFRFDFTSDEDFSDFRSHRTSQQRARSSPSLKSGRRDLNNLLLSGYLSSPKDSPSSLAENFYNDRDFVQSRKRTNKKLNKIYGQSSDQVKHSNGPSSPQFAYNNDFSSPVGGNILLKDDGFSRGKAGAQHSEQEERRKVDLAGENLLHSGAEFHEARFTGRRLLSVDDASSEDDSTSTKRRSTRSTDGSGGSEPGSNTTTVNCSSGHGKSGVQLATLRWDEVGIYFTITAFVMFAGLGKLAFHQMHWLSSHVPESCLLIVLGVIMGLIVFFAKLDSSGECGNVAFPTFDSDSFFLVLLPPIILESAYSLHDRSFIDNLGSVLVFAIFGTLLNIFIIGPSLFGLALSGAMGNFNLTITESLVFSSLISAVDPVAVLSIFQELGVHKGLYFLVFGESLLNDGVTVVVYNMVSVFMEMTVVEAKDYILSVVAFFVVTLVGAFIGVVFGIITALVTRTTTNVRVVEPLALLGFAYLAYLGAEMFHFSGIISLIACGLVQAQYAFQNISDKSYTCVKYFTKMASATSETIIFMFLGMVLVSKDHVWHTGFVLWTLLLCFVVRFIITLLLSAIVNHYRVRRIGISEQLILAYGGLRGAVAFSLVSMLPGELALKEHFVTATLVVILFTVFIQGITMGPLVKWLDVAKRRSGPQILFEEVHVSVVDHMMAGIEEVLGEHGDFYLREQLRVYNEKYLKKWFVRPTCEAPLKRLFEKIAITEHYAHLYGPAELIQQHDMEVYSSKTKLVDEPPSNGNSNRASVQILTTEDDDGRQVEQLKLEQAAPKGELKHRKNSVASILTPWADGGRRESVVSSMRDLSARQLQEDARLLRRAISSNPYNQLHYTHNRNLVNEDNQELQSHLQRRHTTARRLTRLASRSSLRHPSAAAADSPLPPPPTPTIHHQNFWFSGDSTKNSKDPRTYGSQDLEARRSLAPDDAVQLRPHPDARPPSESSWTRQPHLLPRPRPSRMISLPGEVNPLTEDELAQLPPEVIHQVEGVQTLLNNARRRSLWRRAMLQRRLNRTLSGGDKSARNSVYADSVSSLAPASGEGTATAHPVPEEPKRENRKKPFTRHTAIDINSAGGVSDDPLGKLVADLPKYTDGDSGYSQDPRSGYSSDYSTTGYSTDSTLPLAAVPTFEPIPEHQATVDDPLLSGASSGRRSGDTAPKKC